MNHSVGIQDVMQIPGFDIIVIPNSSTLTSHSVRIQNTMQIPGFDIIAIPNSSTLTNHSVGFQHSCNMPSTEQNCRNIRINDGNFIHCQQQCLHHSCSHHCSSTAFFHNYH